MLLPLSCGRSCVIVLMTTSSSDGTTDHLKRWIDKWEESQTGWHEESVHEALMMHGDQLIPGLQLKVPTPATQPSIQATCASSSSRVLVPLCGKTVDMAFLAQQVAVEHVVGVDAVPKALDTFVNEHPDLPLTRTANGYSSAKLTLLQSDFFALDRNKVGSFQTIWDRAALVAIEPSLRQEYVAVLGKLLEPQGRILLVVIERQSSASDTEGPPFSISEDKVREIYGTQEWVGSVTLLNDNGEKERNQSRDMRSLYFLIQAK